MGLTAKKVFAILNKKIKNLESNGSTIDPDDFYNKEQIDSMFERLVEKVPMSQSDTSVILEPGKLYVFPEMQYLEISLMQSRAIIYQEFHFIFQSGSTATILSLPESVISDMAVEPNRIYEVSILDNLLAWTSWAV